PADLRPHDLDRRSACVRGLGKCRLPGTDNAVSEGWRRYRSASEEGRHVTLRLQRQTKLLLVALVFGLHAIAPVPSWGRGNQQTPDAAAEVVDYRIGPGDVLELVVWKEADLTRDIAVRPDGKATVPLIGDIEATGQTPSELASEITKALIRFVSAP